MNIFPADAGPYAGIGSGTIVYSDPRCTLPAAIYKTDGTTKLPGSIAPASSNQRLNPFVSAASVLYIRDSTGVVFTLTPSLGATAPTISGSKGANAALTSLISALAAEGIIVDTTT